MRNPLLRALFCAILVSPLASAQSPSHPPTVADAQAFIDRANAELLKSNTDDDRAQWLADTHITDDTEALVALHDAETTGLTLALTAESHRFDHVDLPPALRRQIMLLQVNTPAAPKDPKLLAEQTQLAAQLTGMYGKGKYCPGTPAGQEPAPGAKCMGIDEISSIMAKSRDPEELTRLWIGWHAIGAPMRDKYARYIELQNIGARELGYHDTGELWRAPYDMTPAQFSAELEHAWQQLEPLYRALHHYVRARLIAQYGKAADRPDGLIPAQLLGNMWAQEWGDIYDIVAPTDPRLSQFKPLDLEAALKQQIAAKDPAAAPAFAAGTDLSSDAGHAAQLAAARDMVHYGEDFFKSIGFAPLPPTFWERSQFVHPRDAEVVCHASAWDIDFADDLRVKMCIDVSADYFTTVHHELGHNFY
ncbi:MAG: M2 family metallopeptidase, partial [Terracidiphilus sp.]